MTTVASPIFGPAGHSPAPPDPADRQFEFVDGRSIEKVRMSFRSNVVGTRIASLLIAAYPMDKAFIATEQPVFCFKDPRKKRIPDVALVWASRLPQGAADEELRIVPDFVAEVVSPTNTYNEIYDRLEDFLAAGLPLGWIVDPVHRFLHFYGADGSGRLARADSMFQDHPALPGFSVRVADLFPPAVAAAGK
jgi:Uma2 family endonuclease